ncbi:MAG: hypothetical protein AB4057_03780 [Crocosphaera sp.]
MSRIQINDLNNADSQLADISKNHLDTIRGEGVKGAVIGGVVGGLLGGPGGAVLGAVVGSIVEDLT